MISYSLCMTDEVFKSYVRSSYDKYEPLFVDNILQLGNRRYNKNKVGLTLEAQDYLVDNNIVNSDYYLIGSNNKKEGWGDIEYPTLEIDIFFKNDLNPSLFKETLVVNRFDYEEKINSYYYKHIGWKTSFWTQDLDFNPKKYTPGYLYNSISEFIKYLHNNYDHK